MLRCCENSLHRLDMDYLDLYLIHWPRMGMKLEETFRALNKLVQDGKVRHLGVSNFNLKLLQKSAALSETPCSPTRFPTASRTGPMQKMGCWNTARKTTSC